MRQLVQRYIEPLLAHIPDFSADPPRRQAAIGLAASVIVHLLLFVFFVTAVWLADEERIESTTLLPQGTYALTLACRSTRRVSFSIENGEDELVDLSLRCGTTRVNVVHLAAAASLSIKVDANGPANFAYRVSRI